MVPLPNVRRPNSAAEVVAMPIDPFTGSLLAAGAKMLAKTVPCRRGGGFALIEMDHCCGGVICKTCRHAAVTRADAHHNRIDCPYCGRSVAGRRRQVAVPWRGAGQGRRRSAVSPRVWLSE